MSHDNEGQDSSSAAILSMLTPPARAAWYTYLGTLAYTVVTLFSIEDSNFFDTGQLTVLPVINLAVPTVAFFWFSSILVSVTYVYLHIVLEPLWLQMANPTSGSDKNPRPMYAPPWLICDLSLVAQSLLHRKAEKGAANISPLRYLGTLTSAIILFPGGPVVITSLWLRSMPAHYPALSVTAGLMLIAMIWTMYSSTMFLVASMSNHGKASRPKRSAYWKFTYASVFTLLLSAILTLSFLRTTIDLFRYKTTDGIVELRQDGSLDWLRPATAKLSGISLVELPPDWIAYDSAMKEFYASWCTRPDTDSCQPDIPLDENSTFQREWRTRREDLVRRLTKPILEQRDMSRIFLANSKLNGIDFYNVNFSDAHLYNSDFSETILIAANFSGAQLSHATLQNADLRTASLSQARIEHTDFQFADLGYAQLWGSPDDDAPMQAKGTVFDNVKSDALGIRHVDLSQAAMNSWQNFSHTFGDDTIVLPAHLKPPCQWIETDPSLSVSEQTTRYMQHWRGWLEAMPSKRKIFHWVYVSPSEEYFHVTPIPPPADCRWPPE